jgi:maltose alpha-D-glucosyltransferase/alpha-amylase
LWAFQISQIFLKAYLDTVQESDFYPKNKADLRIMLDAYLLERAVFDLNYELTNRPDQVLAPVQIIKSIIE